MWQGVIARLHPNFRCVTLDVPGSGLSDRTPAPEQSLDVAVAAVEAVIDALDLRRVTLVVHDLGGLAALAAVESRLDRVSGLAAVNTFAWRPRGITLPIALKVFGSAAVRGISAVTGGLAWASGTRLGVGRNWDKATKRAWRAGLRDRSSRRFLHRLFRDARANRSTQDAAEAAIAGLKDGPLITVFGEFGDYFRFQKQWSARHAVLDRIVVPWGLHFPMCDNPGMVAEALARLAIRVNE
jgi:haloalkane dehalogenase